MADSSPFSKFVPGFDFLQGLVKNANAAMPAMGQWIAPTLDPAELEKRIEELRTVQFWLEQNARLLGATIQALEVQRMTLSTLKNMNVSIGELGEALKVRPTTPTPAPTPAPPPAPPVAEDPPEDEDDLVDEDAPPEEAPSAAGSAPAAAPAAGAVDPMQWWGALTRQFTELAASALKDGSAGAAIQQSIEAAGQTLKAAMPGAAPVATPPAAPRPAPRKTAPRPAAPPAPAARKAPSRKAAAPATRARKAR